MTTMNKILIGLVVSILISIYTVFKIKKSALHKDTKVLLYMMAIGAPIFGFILFHILNRKRLVNG